MTDSPIKHSNVGAGREFLLYWRPDYVDDTRAHFPLLRHAGSNQLQNVSVGDTVWISTVRDGDLFVAGRLQIGECTDWEGAKERLGMDDIWDAKFHVIAAAGTEELMSNLSISDVVGELRFAGSHDRFVPHGGKVDAGQLQPMRELAQDSAALLNSLWTQDRENGKGPIAHPSTSDLLKHTSSNGDGSHGLTAERVLESLGDQLDVVVNATKTPWIAYLNNEAYLLLKDTDPELFYTHEGHEYLRTWENLTIPFIIHMRVEIDDAIPNASPDYGCRREVDSEADPASLPQNIAACLQQVSVKNPRDSQAHYNLGVALTSAGRPEEAIQAYRRALTVYPGMIGAHYNLGTAYLASGEYQLALEQLEETTRLAPEFAQAHFMLGSALIVLGRQALGIEASKRGLELSPDDPGAHFNIGRAFKELKDYEAAIPWLEKTVDLSPEFADAYYEIGRVYQSLGRFEDEYSSYFKAVEIRKDFVQALFALGVAYARLKRGTAARIASQEPPLTLNQKDGETFYFVALAYLALGDMEHAQNWQKSLREIDPRLADELETYLVEPEPDAVPETSQTTTEASQPKFEMKWLEAKQNPFGIRVLDCREFSANTLSTTADEETAARFLSLRESTGVEHREHSPERVVRFQCRLKYSPLDRPAEGALFTASKMEDMWDIYFYDGYLYFVRSWTGLLAYRAWAVFNAGSLVIDLVEADKGDSPADKTYAVRAVDFLIKSHFLKGLVPHPVPGGLESDPEKIALFSFSNFGRWAQYASYEDTLPFIAQETFSPQGAEVVESAAEVIPPDELVSEQGFNSPNEIVFDDGPSSPNEIVFDDGASSPNEIVFDDGASSPNEIVFDVGASSPNEIVLDDEATSRDELVLDAEPFSANELALEDEPFSSSDLVLDDEVASPDELLLDNEVIQENDLSASPDSVIEVSDSVSATNSDAEGDSDEINDPIESVAQADGSDISPVTEVTEAVEDKSDLARAKEALAKARKVVVLTGAGVSAESNVPTFRGTGGVPVWRGMTFEELSSVRMTRDNLPLAWEWFDYQRGVVAACTPNAAHQALAACDLSGRFDEFTLVTDNVDDLQAEAGSTGVIELRGNIWRARCLTCAALRDLRNVPADERPPVCSECGHLMRPDLVLFGESLSAIALEKAQAYAKDCDVCVVIGTSALITSAVDVPDAALQAGKFVIEINPEATAFSRDCNVSLIGLAKEILPQLLPSDGRELVLKIGAEGGGMGIYRKRDDEGQWKYSGAGNSMDVDKQGEEQARTWQYDAGGTLEEAIASLGMSDETLVQLHPVRIHPEYLQAVRDIVDRIARNASAEFRENHWAQESLARWREMTGPAVSAEEPKEDTYTLSSGRTVSLAKLSVTPTYAGQSKGAIETASREIRGQLSSRVADAMPPGTPLVVVDDTTTVLPRFQWFAHFESKGVKTGDADNHSRLYVCWFTDDMSDHFNALIEKVLASIDWEASAEDYK